MPAAREEANAQGRRVDRSKNIEFCGATMVHKGSTAVSRRQAEVAAATSEILSMPTSDRRSILVSPTKGSPSHLARPRLALGTSQSNPALMVQRRSSGVAATFVGTSKCATHLERLDDTIDVFKRSQQRMPSLDGSSGEVVASLRAELQSREAELKRATTELGVSTQLVHQLTAVGKEQAVRLHAFAARIEVLEQEAHAARATDEASCSAAAASAASQQRAALEAAVARVAKAEAEAKAVRQLARAEADDARQAALEAATARVAKAEAEAKEVRYLARAEADEAMAAKEAAEREASEVRDVVRRLQHELGAREEVGRQLASKAGGGAAEGIGEHDEEVAVAVRAARADAQRIAAAYAARQISETRAEVKAEVRAELMAEVAASRAELKKALRAELRAEMGASASGSAVRQRRASNASSSHGEQKAPATTCTSRHRSRV